MHEEGPSRGAILGMSGTENGVLCMYMYPIYGPGAGVVLISMDAGGLMEWIEGRERKRERKRNGKRKRKRHKEREKESRAESR